MNRRERLEAKLEKREEWAGKAEARSEARFDSTRKLADSIPLGQPILVGHHSERHARRDADRIRSGMDKAVELSKLADHHESKARGIARQLDRSVFSDDHNAIEALEARITEREKESEHQKAVNAAFKKAPGSDNAAKLMALVKAGIITSAEAMKIATFFGHCHWEKKPYPSYSLTGLSAGIRRDRDRIEEVKRRNVKTEAAAAAPGGVVIGGNEEWAVVTFADKPDREVLDALRNAGFSWGRGSWTGKRASLPTDVRIMAGELGPCGSCSPPGILQNVNAGEDGHGETQRCDDCKVYADDDAAAAALAAKETTPCP